ncbi:MAG: hypothetical protein ACXWDO_09355 [Bacteroidia bacterium]
MENRHRIMIIQVNGWHEELNKEIEKPTFAIARLQNICEIGMRQMDTWRNIEERREMIAQLQKSFWQAELFQTKKGEINWNDVLVNTNEVVKTYLERLKKIPN